MRLLLHVGPRPLFFLSCFLPPLFSPPLPPPITSWVTAYVPPLTQDLRALRCETFDSLVITTPSQDPHLRVCLPWQVSRRAELRCMLFPPAVFNPISAWLPYLCFLPEVSGLGLYCLMRMVVLLGPHVWANAPGVIKMLVWFFLEVSCGMPVLLYSFIDDGFLW